MGRRRKSEKQKPRKKVNIALLERTHAGKITGPWRIMEQYIEDHHRHLIDATMMIAWRFGWKPDTDGQQTLVQVRKGSDLDRETAGFDFVILLNHEVWNAGTFSEEQMAALIDHALCRCAVSNDANGQPKMDEKNRIVWRLRKPNIVEFKEVVARHGCYTDDLQEFADAARERRERPILNMTQAKEPATAAS